MAHSPASRVAPCLLRPLLLLVLQPAVAGGSAGDGAGAGYVFAGFGSATRAREACRTRGGLPMPRSATEHGALQAAVRQAVAAGHLSEAWPKNTIWLGGRWRANASRWEWDDGRAVAEKELTVTVGSSSARQLAEPWLCMVLGGGWQDSAEHHEFGILCRLGEGSQAAEDEGDSSKPVAKAEAAASSSGATGEAASAEEEGKANSSGAAAPGSAGAEAKAAAAPSAGADSRSRQAASTAQGEKAADVKVNSSKTAQPPAKKANATEAAAAAAAAAESTDSADTPVAQADKAARKDNSSSQTAAPTDKRANATAGAAAAPADDASARSLILASFETRETTTMTMAASTTTRARAAATTTAAAATTTTTTTTTALTETVHDSVEDGCFEDEVAWEPRMRGVPLPKVADSASECQRLCAQTKGCAHFSFWAWGGHCYFQDAFASRWTGRLGFVSGPSECWGRANRSAWAEVGKQIYVPAALACLEPATEYAPLMGRLPKFFLEGTSLEAAEACRRHCASIEGCAHWTLRSTTRMCTLAGTTATRLASVASTASGVPGCGGSGAGLLVAAAALPRVATVALSGPGPLALCTGALAAVAACAAAAALRRGGAAPRPAAGPALDVESPAEGTALLLPGRRLVE